jgi:Transglycosylase SLT domain
MWQLSAYEPVVAVSIFEPGLAKNPGVFASILETAFPRPKPMEKRPEPKPVPTATLENPDELMAFGGKTAPRWLVQSVLRAAHVTGVDPVYLMTLADVESSLSPGAKAPTSSAEGLFQFIDRTWLETVHAHAAEHGFGAVAEAITMVDGDPVITDDKARAWVMSLRRDPYFSALMACELISDIQRELQSDGERELAESELYIAHFLGAGNAVRFLRALDEAPNAPASKLFPKAARANLGLFTELKGRKRRPVSVAEFYDRIDSKITRRLNRYDDLTPGAPPSLMAAGTIEASAVR